MDQEEGSDHVIKTVNFSERASAEAASRVVQRDIAHIGREFHSDLQPKYLKHDCIKLAVKSVAVDALEVIIVN